MNAQSSQAWWVLRIGLGVGPLLAGADKFFNIFTNWEMYLNPLAPRLLHIQPTTFMHIAGVIEMVVGVLVLTRATRYAADVVMAWLIAIALSLVAQGQFFDIAVRDLEVALGAFALARLSEARAKESAGASSTAGQSLNRAIA